MTEPLAPKPTTGEDKPRYEPPQIVDLSRLAKAQGGAGCTNGSAQTVSCQIGPTASNNCGGGTLVRTVISPCGPGGIPFGS